MHCLPSRRTSANFYHGRDEYTRGVDKVRLGRALGYGTRHAAKTLAAVAEAAAALGSEPTPYPQAAAESRPNSTPSAATTQREVRSRLPTRVPSGAQVRGVGRSVWAPLATFSGALWLRVTGVFFAVIALAMVNGAWRLRGVLQHRAGSAVEVRHLWVFAAFAVLFGYFALSSFVRANLRERLGARRQTA